MWAIRFGATILLAAVVAGCGTYVPGIPEFPKQPSATQDLMKAILHSVHCEIKNSVQWVVRKDIEFAKQHRDGIRYTEWFDGWGVEGALTLTISEKTELNPTATWVPNPVTELFKLGLGVEASTEATRINTLNFFYTVKALNTEESCDAFPYVRQHPPGSLLINSDLGLREWLQGVMSAVQTSSTVLLREKGFTQSVSFQVVSKVDITPTWTLTRFVINPDGKFLAATRDRTHELLLTFGPLGDDKKTITGPAAGEFFAGQIGSAISNRLRTIPR
jgi:hypothetical protein